MDAHELTQMLTLHDLKRLESYARNLLDYHVCVDLLPPIARSWFLNTTPVTISTLQAAILLGIGLQHKTVDDLEVSWNIFRQANHIVARQSVQTTDDFDFSLCLYIYIYYDSKWAERIVASRQPITGAVQSMRAQI